MHLYNRFGICKSINPICNGHIPFIEKRFVSAVFALHGMTNGGKRRVGEVAAEGCYWPVIIALLRGITNGVKRRVGEGAAEGCYWPVCYQAVMQLVRTIVANLLPIGQLSEKHYPPHVK